MIACKCKTITFCANCKTSSCAFNNLNDKKTIIKKIKRIKVKENNLLRVSASPFLCGKKT